MSVADNGRRPVIRAGRRRPAQPPTGAPLLLAFAAVQLLATGAVCAAFPDLRASINDPALWLQAMALSVFGACALGGCPVLLRAAGVRRRAVTAVDQLTGVADRSLFLEQADVAFRILRSTVGEGVAVLYLGIDDFRTVNEGVGYAGGNSVLAALAERLRAIIEGHGVVGRLGGDEFGILLTCDPILQCADMLARRIHEALEEPFDVDGRPVAITVGIGLAVADGRPAAEVVHDAGLAMHCGKRRGRAQISRAHHEMVADALRHFDLVRDLSVALDKHEFRVDYQPIVAAADWAPVGVEAALRWQHAARGLVPPSEFLGAAESSGVMVPVGRWVLQEATSQVARWLREGRVGPDFYVSVNLSPGQLAEPSLVADVTSALLVARLPATNLVLEMTENVLIPDFAACMDRLHDLRARGVRIALDDFGTGYSALSRLSRLPVDLVKIDQSFIGGIDEGRAGLALLKGAIDVAHAVGLSCVAEGVRSRGQLQALADLGCEAAQGALFGRAAPAQDTLATLGRLPGAARPPREKLVDVLPTT